jgi:dihydropteroate synthase
MTNEQFKQWCNLFHQQKSEHSKPLIMGILNVTPDSFSDGGLYLHKKAAVLHALRMIAGGADIIDLGGESSQPGAKPIGCEEELQRVIPVIEALRAETDACIAIDTTKAQVMKEAVAAGAGFINDIKALHEEGSMHAAAQLDVPVCLMHMQGEPESMQKNPYYEEDVLEEINDYFAHKITTCLSAGINFKNLILDPGFGYGKLVTHNLRIVNHLEQFHRHDLPLLLGASRKHTLGVVLGKPVNERLVGGLAIAMVAASKGVAILRTHDVEATAQALTMLQAIRYEKADNLE